MMQQETLIHLLIHAPTCGNTRLDRWISLPDMPGSGPGKRRNPLP